MGTPRWGLLGRRDGDAAMGTPQWGRRGADAKVGRPTERNRVAPGRRERERRTGGPLRPGR